MVITAVVGALSKVVISTYHHGYEPDSFLEDHQRDSVYLENMRAVFVVGRRLSWSLLNVKLCRTLRLVWAITQSMHPVGMPLKVFTERHNILKQTY